VNGTREPTAKDKIEAHEQFMKFLDEHPDLAEYQFLREQMHFFGWPAR
jgi:hypothetical protein